MRGWVNTDEKNLLLSDLQSLAAQGLIDNYEDVDERTGELVAGYELSRAQVQELLKLFPAATTSL